MPEKRCCTCKEVKSLDEFSKDRTTKDGLKYQCRRCRNAQYEQTRDKYSAQTTHPNLPGKLCPKCGKTKPRNEFYIRRASKDGLCSRCKPCTSIQRAESYKENRLRVIARSIDWYNRNKTRVAAHNAKLRREQPERVHIIDAVHKHNRRIRGGPRLSAATVSAIKDASGGVCPYCNLTIENGHLDHIVALANGGTNVRENLIWVCGTCNMEKGTKPLYEFLVQKWATIVSEYNGEIHA